MQREEEMSLFVREFARMIHNWYLILSNTNQELITYKKLIISILYRGISNFFLSDF